MLVWALLLILEGSVPASTDQVEVGSRSPVLPEVWNELAMEYLSREEGRGCTDCQEVRQILEARLPEINITQIRLEIFKEDLLRRLGMSEPPTTSPGLSLPGPVLQGDVFHRIHQQEPIHPRLKVNTQRVVVMASEVECTEDEEGQALTLRFELPPHTANGTIVSGKLWLHAISSPNFRRGLVIVTSCNSTGLPAPSPVRIQMADLKGSWIETDVTRMIQPNDYCYNIKISWPADNSSSNSCSLFEETTERPFLMSDVISSGGDENARDKRNVDCVEGLTDCCREKLYVSFKSIGWDDWIIQPRGYEAYYCKGSCANIASISLSASPYHSVIKKLSSEGNFVHIKPCCTPTKLSSVQLIYKDHNSTVVQKTIPNLTVEACGCM